MEEEKREDGDGGGLTKYLKTSFSRYLSNVISITDNTSFKSSSKIDIEKVELSEA